MEAIALMHEQLRAFPVPALARYLFWRMSPDLGERRIILEGRDTELLRADVNDYRVPVDALDRFDREEASP